MALKKTSDAPRAVIHKRILESAESAPEASFESLAADVAGASPDLIERVLEEYGDPADTAPSEPTTTEDPSTAASVPHGAVAELTEKQRETLRAIAERPEANQAALAEELGVSRATVSRRLNAIDGFDWAERSAFATALLEEDGGAVSTDLAGSKAATVDGGQLLSADVEEAVEQLQERVARLERQVGETVDEASSDIEDAELLAKVLRVVMAADEITADEEVAVLEALR